MIKCEKLSIDEITSNLTVCLNFTKKEENNSNLHQNQLIINLNLFLKNDFTILNPKSIKIPILLTLLQGLFIKNNKVELQLLIIKCLILIIKLDLLEQSFHQSYRTISKEFLIKVSFLLIKVSQCI